MSEKESTEEQTVYLYYPAYGHTFRHTFPSGKTVERPYARRVVAGVVKDQKIYVAEAVCFTGNKVMGPDQFNRKLGAQIAKGRALKASNFVPTEEHPNNPAVAILEIPEGETSVGKFFVSAVEKIYPAHVSTKRKKETN